MKQNLADLGAVGGLEHQRVDQHVGRDVHQGRGPDDGGARGVCGAQEDVVHALDRLGAVLRPAQVEGQDFGAGNGGLQGLFMNGQPQVGVPGGQGERKIGSDEPGATGD